jgi:hypothetical protein
MRTPFSGPTCARTYHYEPTHESELCLHLRLIQDNGAD